LFAEQNRFAPSDQGSQLDMPGLFLTEPRPFSVGLTLIVLFGFALVVRAAAIGGLSQTRTATDSTARIAQYCDPKQQSDGADAPKIYCLTAFPHPAQFVLTSS
jgi:hypothetical protein